MFHFHLFHLLLLCVGPTAPTPCPVGGLCDGSGRGTPSLCTPGSYCATGGEWTVLEFLSPLSSFISFMFQVELGLVLFLLCGAGLSAVTGKCDGGFFCQPGSSVSNASVCTVGFFCPKGSASKQVCKPGAYCDSTGLSAPAGLCQAGYYCAAGSSSATRVLCLATTYCPPGSSTATLCPLGSFCPSNALGEPALCTPGHYCAYEGTKRSQ